jgi:hypothetical protein
MSDAETNCSHRKVPSTARGFARTNAQDTVSTNSNAKRNPSIGDNTMKAPVVNKPGQTMALLNLEWVKRRVG